jgi:hypothetical protein
MDDSARLLLTVLLAAFVIERAVAVFAFLGNTSKWSERKRTISQFALAAVLGALAVRFADIHVLSQLHKKVLPWIDYALSWLILVAGADRIRDFVGGGGGGGGGGHSEAAEKKSELPPIVVNIIDKDGHLTPAKQE